MRQATSEARLLASLLRAPCASTSFPSALNSSQTLSHNANATSKLQLQALRAATSSAGDGATASGTASAESRWKGLAKALLGAGAAGAAATAAAIAFGGTALAEDESDLDRMYYHGAKVRPTNPYEQRDPKQKTDGAGLPIMLAPKSYAPNVPPPITRKTPAHLVLELETLTVNMPVSPLHKYTWWTYDGTVPAPMVRARVGDVLEVRYKNSDIDGIGHNIDFHCVTGPGGGAAVTYTEAGETKIATFKLLHPGFFMYHCAAAPVPTHIANGMYGFVLVEPENGLDKVDKEFYVVQSEVYAEESEERGQLDHSYSQGLDERPMYVVLNGSQGAMTEKAPLQAEQGDRVRIFFGNAGPNLISSFHIIGTIFDKVYREGDLLSPPGRSIQTTTVPAGGSAVIELDVPVPGNFALVDHALFRLDKGCVGFLKVRPNGKDRRRDIYDSLDPPSPCPGCKLHN